ncbi:hypothetical protein D3C73_664630 [compost metagenome]
MPAILTSSPLSLTSLICGRMTILPPRVLGVMTTSVDRPVTSSTCLATVTPSSMFSKRTAPPYSDTIGRVSGSHVARRAPAFTASPSPTSTVAPYGILWRSRSRPLSSKIASSPEREIATRSPLAFVT